MEINLQNNEPKLFKKRTTIFNRALFYTLLFISCIIIFRLLIEIGLRFFNGTGMDFRFIFFAMGGTIIFFIISTIIFEILRSKKI